MDLKATIAGSYRNRLLLIALGTLLYAAWCFYDGMYAYPEKQDIFREWQQTKELHPEEWRDIWADKIAETGWPAQPKEVTDGDIRTQWIQFAIVFPIGTFCLLSLAIWSRRYIGADQSKLYTHGGVEVPFEKITSIDATRWERKGIARVRYASDSGEGAILIDDWKYQREPTDEIFKRLRKQVDAGRIEGLADASEPVDEPDQAASPDDKAKDEAATTTTA